MLAFNNIDTEQFWGSCFARGAKHEPQNGKHICLPMPCYTNYARTLTRWWGFGGGEAAPE